MYARVARWEGADAEASRRATEEMKKMAPQGPPPGVPGTGFTLLVDHEAGTSMAIALFETEEDMRTGDAALNAMTPSSEDTGSRVSVEMYEVGVDVRL